MDERNELLTPQQVAAILKVSVGTVLRLLRGSGLRGVKLGRHWRIRRGDLSDYLEGATPQSLDVASRQIAAQPVAAPSVMVPPTGSPWRLVVLAVLALLVLQVALLFWLVLTSSGQGRLALGRATITPSVAATSVLVTAPVGVIQPRQPPLSVDIVAISSEPTPTPTSLATPSPPSQATSRPTPSPSPAPTSLVSLPEGTAHALARYTPLSVGNTGGSGVYVRGSPRATDRVRAWPDGTTMVVVGDDAQAEGIVWRYVMDPGGGRGWVPAEYLLVPPQEAARAAHREKTGEP